MGVESYPSPVPPNISSIVAAATGEMAVGKTAAEAAGTGGGEKKSTALAPGFRFHPTDEELVIYYLKRKVSNKPFRFNAIAEVDIYKNEPWDLADKASLKSRDQEWYFFSPLDKKYGNGARMNRATGRGYWKATGKDREIRRNSKLLAMKKTLVFHSGRAPGGQRTNWVMHEYRLVDEELERTGTCFRALEKPGPLQFDSYVLCRVFHKNNIGPPTGNRYAPFLEEEWDDGKSTIVPGDDALDEVDTDSIYKDLPSADEIPKKPQLTLPLFKDETEDSPRVHMLSTDAPFPLLQYKRRKQSYDNISNHSNGSESSDRMSRDPCSSTTTTAATPSTTTTDSIMTTSATTAAVSALLEFSLSEPFEPEEKPQVIPSVLEAANLDSLVPPSCSKFIKDLQNEVHKVSVEREKLKLEMMSAQAMINILQSRIKSLDKENEDLKMTIRDTH